MTIRLKKTQAPIVRFWAPLLALLCLVTGGCSTVSYFSQAASGHLHIMRSRTPIEEVLKGDDLGSDSKDKLKMVLEVRAFASEKLGLPRNKSYTVYSEVQGEYLGWNVYAAPEFSVEPTKWCFPIAGCVVYRGFFSKEKALEFARKVKEKHADVFVAPFNAYSTLGWYNDPVLSSQLRLNPVRLAGLIIHELAHQKFYVPGDSRFNEAFAVTVERAGVLEWLRSTGRDKLVTQALKMWDKEDRQAAEILKARSRLSDLYLSGVDVKSLSERKSAIFRDLKAELHRLSYAGGEPSKMYREELELNNAYLVPTDTYYSLVPAFQNILNRVGGSLPRFYERVQELAKLPKEERQREIESVRRVPPTQPLAAAVH